MNNKLVNDEQQLADLLSSALREEPSLLLTKSVMNRIAMVQQKQAQYRLGQAQHNHVAVIVVSFLLVLLLAGLTSSISTDWQLNKPIWVDLDLDSMVKHETGLPSLIAVIGSMCLAGAIWIVGSIDRHHRFNHL